MQEAISRLQDFMDSHRRLFVLTGAGISTGSGIPDYRDTNGDWKRPAPVQFRDFVGQHATRQRYWARSLIGWPWFQQARPNRCHATLAGWERDGNILMLVTQNVDRLHQRAGSVNVIDLHGRLDRVVCLECRTRLSRVHMQARISTSNPGFVDRAAEIAPDGDAVLPDRDYSGFVVPACPACGGILKPDVVFYGENVPRYRVDAAMAALDAADGLLVIGSSLMVYSGFRYCRHAAGLGIPQVAINRGRTRADDLFAFKVDARFEDVADALAG